VHRWRRAGSPVGPRLGSIFGEGGDAFMGRNRRKKERDGGERVLVSALLAAGIRITSSLITTLLAWWLGHER